VECTLNECGPLQLIQVGGKAESRLWRELVERHHYLACRVPLGAHLRYFVRDRERELACLLWILASLEDGAPRCLDRMER
jgi:hypothetical protein